MACHVSTAQRLCHSPSEALFSEDMNCLAYRRLIEGG